MNNLIKTALYTIRDQTRHKSFYIILIISALFVFLIRGCYDANLTINQQKLDHTEIAWHISTIVFQVICYGMFLMTALLSMKIFSRDQSDGSTVMYLSRPVDRWQYVFGRISGIWVVCLLFMLLLHTIIFFITWSKTGNLVPGFLAASLIASINLLLITCMVCLFSLFMPDFVAAFASIGIIGIGFISETGYRILQSKIVQDISRGDLTTDASLWQICFPKFNMLQYYAGTVIKNSEFQGMGPIHPVINVLIYLIVAGVLLLVVFNRREIG
jgi:ABC-type transport system involved in multi-copper enzyme maturation permease subunit